MTERIFTFEELPQAASQIHAEVQELRHVVEEFISSFNASEKPADTDELVGIDEACQILGLKKSTLYHKAQRKEIKSYKPDGCKMLLFKRSDLMQWVENSGRKIDNEAILAELRGSVRHKPRSIR